MPIEEISWDKQDYVRCDERGRATLGMEFANEGVFVYIAEVPDLADLERPDDETTEVLSNMASWAMENVDDWFDLKPESGIVVDKYGDEHQSPFSL